MPLILPSSAQDPQDFLPRLPQRTQAQLLHNASVERRFNGIEAPARVTDWQAVVRPKRDLVDKLRQAKYTDVPSRYNTVTYVEGKVSFTVTGSLEVDGKLIDASGCFYRPSSDQLGRERIIGSLGTLQIRSWSHVQSNRSHSQ